MVYPIKQSDAREAFLNLLVSVMVADRQIVRVEVEECEQAMRDCFGERHPIALMQEPDFIARCKTVDRIMRGPGRKAWVGLQYLRLQDHPDHDALLKRLWAVAVCDRKLDSRETYVIDLLASLWERRHRSAA